MKKEDIASKQRKKNFEARPLGEENNIDFHPKGFALFINGRGEAELPSIQNPNPQNVDPRPKILSQPNQ